MHKLTLRASIAAGIFIASASIASATTVYPLTKTFNYGGVKITKIQSSENRKLLDDSSIIIGSLFLAKGAKSARLPTDAEQRRFSTLQTAYQKAYGKANQPLFELYPDKQRAIYQTSDPEVKRQRILELQKLINAERARRLQNPTVIKEKPPVYGVEFFGSRPTPICPNGFAVTQGLCALKPGVKPGEGGITQAMPTCIAGYSMHYTAAINKAECWPALEMLSQDCPLGFYYDSACYPYRKDAVCPKNRLGKNGICTTPPNTLQ